MTIKFAIEKVKNRDRYVQTNNMLNQFELLHKLFMLMGDHYFKGGSIFELKF